MWVRRGDRKVVGAGWISTIFEVTELWDGAAAMLKDFNRWETAGKWF